MSLTVGSLFSGIGGIDLGLARAGMEIKWQVENDEFCNRVLARHWPHVRRWGDVATFPPDAEPVDERGLYTRPRQASSENLGGSQARTRGQRVAASSGVDGWSVDLICGGFPCQPVSVAGRRSGVSDPRWLWPEMLRVVKALRPRWVLIENVPGLLSIEAGRVYGAMLNDLDALGYVGWWHCLGAAHVGAPHIRDRVFIVAHAEHIGQRLAFQPERQRWGGAAPDAGSDGSVRTVADADSTNTERWRCPVQMGRGGIKGEDKEDGPPGSEWSAEPDVGRVAHGIPNRVDRLRVLGNAVVSQVAEYVGRCILEQDTMSRTPTQIAKDSGLLVDEPKPRPWEPLKLVGRSQVTGARIFENAYYTAMRHASYQGIVRIDIINADQSARRDWREFQQIKNELVGRNATGIEIYPPEHRKIDPTNMFILWVFPRGLPVELPDPGQRDVSEPNEALAPQRAFAEGLDK